MSTILTIVQDFCEKTGLPRPSALVGVQEKSIAQLRAILQEVLEDLGKYRWEAQALRATWTSVAGSDQGALTSLFGTGYSSLVPDTLWNNTRVMRIFGPVRDDVWQAFQALPNAGPEYRCWVSGGHLYVSPALVAGNTLSGIYRTKYGILAVDGVTTKERFTADDDSPIFPDGVVRRGLEYKWRKQKGESGWEDDYNAYIDLVARAIVKDGAPVMTLDNTTLTARPGIYIPAGNWNV